MKKTKKLSVSVAIPAYNEETNIENIIKSVFKQIEVGFKLVDVVVYSDACIDRTIEIITGLKRKFLRIKLIKGKERKGKYYRVNQAFRNNKSDILVILDADIDLVGNYFIRNLINEFRNGKNVCMVVAHQIPLRAKSFIGKVLHTNFAMWDYVRLNLPEKDNAHNFYGSATAYSKTFCRSVHIPDNLSDPHLYIYLSANQYGEFKYCRKAEILSWPISTLEDMGKFLRRSIGKKDNKLERIFGKTVEEVYFIPRRYKLTGVIKCFFRYPFYTPVAILVTFIMNKKVMSIKQDKKPVWDIVKSTKKSFSEDNRFIKVKIYTNLNSRLIKEWNFLWKKLPKSNPFNSVGWFRSAIKAFNYKDYKIVTVYKGNQLVALVPLIKRKIFAIDIYTTPAVNYSQRQGFLCDYEDIEILKVLVDELKRIGNIYLTFLSEGILQNMIKVGVNLSVVGVETSPSIILSSNKSGELILAKKEQILKKARSVIGKLVMKTFRENIGEILSLVFEIDNKSTKQKYGYSVFSVDENKKFYLNLAKYLNGNIFANILYNGNIAVSYEVGFVDKNRYIDSERAYLYEHEGYTPGKVLMVKTAEMLAKDGFKIFDLGPGLDNLKKSLSNNEDRYFNCFISGNLLLRFYYKSIFSLRKIIYRETIKHKYLYSFYRSFIN